MTKSELMQILESKPPLWYAYKPSGINWYTVVKVTIRRLIMGSSNPNGTWVCNLFWEPDQSDKSISINGQTRTYLTKEEAIEGLSDVFDLRVWPGEDQEG